jgi:hypothetical protein
MNAGKSLNPLLRFAIHENAPGHTRVDRLAPARLLGSVAVSDRLAPAVCRGPQRCQDRLDPPASDSLLQPRHDRVQLGQHALTLTGQRRRRRPLGAGADPCAVDPLELQHEPRVLEPFR